MFRRLKRYRAVGTYFWRLSGELSGRFGQKKHYNIKEVSKAEEDQKLNVAFIAYAHAMFCSRPDFDAHYSPMKVACTYDGLRGTVGRRFFGGSTGFNAMNILIRAEPPKNREYDFSQSSNVDD